MKTKQFLKRLFRLIINLFSPGRNAPGKASSHNNDVSLSLCVITQFFVPDYAPTGQLIDELTQALSHQVTKIEVFSGQPGYAFRFNSAPSSERRNQVHIRRSRIAQLWPQRVRGKAINGLLFFIHAGLHLLKVYRRYDIILLTTAPPFLPFLGYLVNVLLGKPYVCLLYDLYPDIAIELNVISSNHWLVKFWRRMNSWVWQRAKAIIVLSPSMKQKIVSYCPTVEDKISVIHSWADPQHITPILKHKNWFAWKYDLVERFTVLYSGNMGRCHDMNTILKAAEHLRDEAIQFVFIGGGVQRATFMEKVEQLNLSNCLFLPYQDKDVLPYSLTACNLSLVSVSSGMEDLVAPSKLYAALSAGRPIAAICSPKSYLTQLIKEADCGASFENENSQGLIDFIRFLNRDIKAAEQMGANGRQYLEHYFTPEIIAKQYFVVLQRAVFGERLSSQHARFLLTKGTHRI